MSAAVAEAPQRAQEEAPGAGAAMRAAAEAQQLRELEDKARFGRAAASPAMPATMHYLHPRVHACLPNAILLCFTVDELEWTCTSSPLVPSAACLPVSACVAQRFFVCLHPAHLRVRAAPAQVASLQAQLATATSALHTAEAALRCAPAREGHDRVHADIHE